MNKIIKDQINQLKPSATLAINEESNRLKRSGKKVYKFGFGQSPFPVPDSIISALKNNANKNTYLPMQGLEELRSAIANYLNKNNNNNFKSDDILVGPGTKELMLLTQIAFQGEVLLPAPSWVSYHPQALIAKNKVHWIQTVKSSNWFPTAEQLENKIKSIKNKNLLLFINSPNNPSGTVCKNLQEIAEIAKNAGALVPWLRPSELATDTASSVDVGLHALEWYERENGKVDGLMLLQPTSPFRSRESVLQGIELFRRHKHRPVIGISVAKSHPMWCFEIENGIMHPFIIGEGLNMRSQDLPSAYIVNGAFYLISPEELRKQRLFYTENVVPLIITAPEESLDIDTEWDWKLAETIIRFEHTPK